MAPPSRTPGRTARTPRGKTSQPLIILKNLDVASPALFKLLDTLDQVTVEIRLFITSAGTSLVQLTAGGNTEGTIGEHVGFVYDSITLTDVATNTSHTSPW